MSDYDVIFILSFTDGREGVQSMDFDSLHQAEHLQNICNRPSSIREVGYDYFSQTKIDRVRVIMR